MPAGSESAGGVRLPRTWRPLGTRIAGVFCGVLLLVGFTAAWVLLPAEVRADFSGLQRFTMTAMIAGAGAVLWALVRSRVTATDDGLIVVNGYRRYRYSWAQVVAARLPSGAPWVTLDLSDGTTRGAMGIQSSDGLRARTAVRELNAVIDRDAPRG